MILRKYFGKVCDIKMKSLENKSIFMKILLSQEDVHMNGLRTNFVVKSARKSSNKEKSRPDDFGFFFLHFWRINAIFPSKQFHRSEREETLPNLLYQVRVSLLVKLYKTILKRRKTKKRKAAQEKEKEEDEVRQDEKKEHYWALSYKL